MRFTFLLVCSLATGLACAALFRARDRQPDDASTSGIPINFLVTNPAVVEATVPPAEGSAGFGTPFHWRELESSDLKRYIANLCAVGCPTQTVRDIIVSLLNRRFAPRLVAINRFESDPASHDPATEKQLADLESEKQRQLAEVLGPDATLTGRGESNESWPDSLAGYIAADKLEAVRQLLNRFFTDQGELQQRLKENRGSNVGLEAELSSLSQRQREELAAVLTPAELEDYDLRNSQTARALRLNLSGFNPSEREFREIFREQQKLDETFGMSQALGRPPTGTDSERYNAAKAELEARLKATLGEERFANYQRSQNNEYQELVRAVDRYDLKPELPDQIWSLRETALTEKQRLLDQPNLTLEQRQAALGELANQTRQSVAAVMGEASLRRYERLQAKPWLKELANVREQLAK